MLQYSPAGTWKSTKKTYFWVSPHWLIPLIFIFVSFPTFILFLTTFIRNIHAETHHNPLGEATYSDFQTYLFYILPVNFLNIREHGLYMILYLDPYFILWKHFLILFRTSF